MIAYGVFRRDSEDFLARCGVETLLVSLGTVLQFFPAFVRVREGGKEGGRGGRGLGSAWHGAIVLPRVFCVLYFCFVVLCESL